MNIKIQLTFSGHIFGLTLAPHVKSVWSPPSYAVDVKIRETNTRFGNRLFRRVGGTLTLPAETGSYPCIVLISGSGPNDRDSSVGVLKPFKDITLGLTAQGTAVCRLDKITYTNKLLYLINRRAKERMTLLEEYAQVSDAIHFVSQHKEIKSGQIFTLGHSLGGLVAGHIAATYDRIAGCILMATPCEPVYRCAIRQFRYIASLDESNKEASQKVFLDAQELEDRASLADSPDLSLATPAKKLPFGIGPAYWLECRSFNPIITTKQHQKPILVLHGGRDYQVTLDDHESLQTTLHDRDNVKFRVFEKLNHCFVAGEGMPSPAEYETAGNVSFEVTKSIFRWINVSENVG